VNPADRTELIAAAKKTALPAARCVAAGVRLDHLLNGKTWHELAALLTVVLEAVDHAKLNALVQLPGDEGLTPETLREAMLRRAHAEVWRLRGAGEEIPLKLGLLENEYQAAHPRQPKPEPQQEEEAA
jgi:hypothetical protein